MIIRNKGDMDYVKRRFIPVRNKLLSKFSPAEDRFAKLLTEGGIYFRREKGNYRYGSRWSYYDFYLPYHSLYVEIDGPSHGTDEQRAIDAVKEHAVKSKGKFIVRLTNEAVMSMDSVNVNDLLDECFRQSAAKRRKGGAQHSRNKYDKIMYERRSDGVRDILDTANFDVDLEREVWLYDHAIGKYFRFGDIVEAKFSVEMSVNEIHDLCERERYARSAGRRYVFAYTLADCEMRVAQVYY